MTLRPFRAGRRDLPRPAPLPRSLLPVVLLSVLVLPVLPGCQGAGLDGYGVEVVEIDDASRDEERLRMVDRQLRRRGIRDERVLAAMERVPRHQFVPPRHRAWAYDDSPLPIGHRQTISQPYVVALMCELLQLGPDDRVLEIGTGSGYHAAVLSHLAASVHSIEILEPLAERARRTLEALGYDNVHVRAGDGYRGWPELAPFDAVLLTAAPPNIPPPLLDQLADGGRLVAPVGEGLQELVRITRIGDRFRREEIAVVQFVPMTGEAERGGG